MQVLHRCTQVAADAIGQIGCWKIKQNKSGKRNCFTLRIDPEEYIERIWSVRVAVRDSLSVVPFCRVYKPMGNAQ